jgi:asparagine synthase (glutamine-hydrolysing)
MSGIAGVYYRDRRIVENDTLHCMGASLAHRGLDGISYFRKDYIGLVQCQTYDTPESCFAILPNRIENDKYVLVFHGRIDNRDELYRKLYFTGILASIADSDLLMAAYLKWGTSCLEHLLGDFAFALWDSAQQQLFCGRDHMGVKPLYYYLSDSQFVFASEIKALHTLSEVPKLENTDRIADYVMEIETDKESTFFKDILRLPPGHFMVIYPDKASCVRYHDFTAAKLHCRNSKEYEEQFRDLFIDAVKVRLRSAFPVGAYLSGGLDSSSIVCTAMGLCRDSLFGELHTFSGIFNRIKNCDEREYFSSVFERYNVRSHTITVDEINPGIVFDKIMSELDEPFLAPHIFMGVGLLLKAKSAGVRIMLDGHDGDAAVSYGYRLLTEHAISANFIKLFKCYKELGVISNTRVVKNILSLLYKIAHAKIHTQLGISPLRKEIKNCLSQLAPDFVNRTAIQRRLEQTMDTMPFAFQSEKEFHLKNITQPIHASTLEFFDQISAKEGVSVRYPYFDKRIIEFCLALPAQEKLRDGLNRNIVRKSLQRILPSKIIQRKSKTDFSPSFVHAFNKNDTGWVSTNVDNLSAKTYNYFNKDICQKLISKYKGDKHSVSIDDLHNLIILITFSRWKEETFN